MSHISERALRTAFPARGDRKRRSVQPLQQYGVESEKQRALRLTNLAKWDRLHGVHGDPDGGPPAA